MRHRFVTEKSNSYLKNLLLSLGIFAAVFLAFWLAVSSVSSRTDEEEMRTLQTAACGGSPIAMPLRGRIRAAWIT